MYTSRINHSMIQKQIDVLQDLALCELVEFHAPLAYALGLFVAYYGPNNRLFGNIGNSYWTYSAIEDINQFSQNLMYLFLVDCSSAVASAIIIWSFCKINLCQAFNELQNESSKTFCLYLGYLLLSVCMIP